jgi:hypothetical protein
MLAGSCCFWPGVGLPDHQFDPETGADCKRPRTSEIIDDVQKMAAGKIEVLQAPVGSNRNPGV